MTDYPTLVMLLGVGVKNVDLWCTFVSVYFWNAFLCIMYADMPASLCLQYKTQGLVFDSVSISFPEFLFRGFH